MPGTESGARLEIIFTTPLASWSLSDTMNRANVEAEICFESVDFDAEGANVLLERKVTKLLLVS